LDSPCTWFGTRGYLITHSGAQHLLRHAYPISVQVFALILIHDDNDSSSEGL
jgi:hypothetical protein